MNLGQVCFFSNLITTPPVQWCGIWVGVVKTSLFFCWFQGPNLLVDNQNFKRSGGIKEGGPNVKWESIFFFFINQN